MNLENFKAEVHRTLLSKLDLEKLSRINSSQARQAVSSIINEIISDRRVPLSFDEQEKIQTDLLDEVFGLGPLEPLLKDQKISDILVNDKDHVFIEKGGLLTRADASFRDDKHLLQIIDRIVSRVGRRVDESSPMVDARLPDGSRVNAIIPPLALDGPALSIRRFGTGPLAANQLVQLKSISPEMMELLSAEPTPDEILVQGVQMHRWAERDGTYAELVAQRSAPLAHLPGRDDRRRRAARDPAVVLLARRQPVAVLPDPQPPLGGSAKRPADRGGRRCRGRVRRAARRGDQLREDPARKPEHQDRLVAMYSSGLTPLKEDLVASD